VASPRTVWNSVADGAEVRAHFAIRLTADAATDEHDPGVSLGGKNGQGCGQTGMHADTADRGLITKRGLPAEFHWHRTLI